MFADEFRPKTLDEVIGNDHIKAALSKYLEKGNLPHTITLHGQYGAGKTSIARIIASELGASNGITEWDCGADGDIAKIREIVSNSDFGSLFSDKKVIILDEVQKLSKAAQQVLLKTTEEPAPDTYYIMCTTDIQDVIPALASRGVMFKVNPVGKEGVREAYRRVMKKHVIKLEGGADDWEKIIDASEGSLRIVYNTLDKVVAAGEPLGNGVYLSTETLDALLGLVNESEEMEETMPLPQAVMKKSLVGALDAVAEAKREKREPIPTMIGLYNYLKKARLNQSRPMLTDLAEILSDPSRANWYSLEYLILKHL